MKKQLLPQVARYFKTNLHTHTTISDGKLTPDEVVEEYKARGYQVLCLTDHNVIADHSAKNDTDFLMLTGTELNVNSPQKNSVHGGTYHLNFIAKRPDNLWVPCVVGARYPNAAAYEALMQNENIPATHTVDSINEIIQKANEKGFLVMYNHPTWSCHSYPDYAGLKGVWGMELRNTECCLIGHNENNPRVFKDLLNLGNRVYPVGADDMHKPAALGVSYIMVGAEKLTYESVIRALENGDFYMSCGPEISELSVEEGQLCVTCSAAVTVSLESHGRFARRVSATKGETLTTATFDITPLLEKADEVENAFVYVTVTAADGSYATTRAYFADELR